MRHIAVVCVVVVGCAADEPKTTRMHAEVSDAGVAATTAARGTKEPQDAGVPHPDAVSGDAGAALPRDAGLMVVVDAGVRTETAPKSDKVKGGPQSGKTTTFDRVLVKPKDSSMSADAIRALVEEKSNRAVRNVRRSAGAFYVVTFEALPAGRGAKEQKQLVESIAATDAFSAVEGDRMMQLR